MSAFLPNSRIDRRTLLAGAGASALLAGGLSGCGQTTGKTNTASANQSVRLPTYAPVEAAEPDFPGTEEGVEAAYKTYPSQRRTTVPEKPGSGKEKVAAMVINYATLPPPVSRNTYWQGLNERLGLDFDVQMTPNADYQQKFATVIAGNELPDIMLTQVVANFPALLDKRFQPLDEYLAGDAIKDYPNLANIPTEIWKSVVYNGKIFGLPLPRGLVGVYHFIRVDRFKAAGVSTEPKSYEELIEVGKALTDRKKRQWAYATIGQPRGLLARVNEQPNTWAEEGGRFTHMYETDACKQSLSDLIQMWKSGVIHPDAFNEAQPFKELFASGNTAINANDGYTGFNSFQLTSTDPDFELGLMPVYKRDGSALAPWALGSGSFGMASMKKAEPERIKLLLRLCNYLAAPFGSEEYSYISYGQEGVDHRIDKQGNPILTQRGLSQTTVQSRYVGDCPKAIYTPGRPQDAKLQHDYQSQAIPLGVQNAALGLFSNTSATKGALAETKFTDAVNEIVQGRQPFESFDDVLSTWKKEAGDAMRTEYQDQLQQAGGR